MAINTITVANLQDRVTQTSLWFLGAGTAYPSGAHEFTPVFSGIRVNTQSLDLYAQ
jgi:hypothetical protein